MEITALAVTSTIPPNCYGKMKKILRYQHTPDVSSPMFAMYHYLDFTILRYAERGRHRDFLCVFRSHQMTLLLGSLVSEVSPRLPAFAGEMPFCSVRFSAASCQPVMLSVLIRFRPAHAPGAFCKK